MDSKRVYLNKGEKIKLVRDGVLGEPGEWIIGDLVGDGASSVCYAAISGNKHGRLKQFNPIGKTITARAIEEFLAAYRTLDSVKNKDEHFAVLNNYIPYYEILFERDETGTNIGAFIWTPDDKSGKNFEEYLLEVRNNPKVNSEQKLRDIIGVLITLSDCICLMHMAGLLHLDIKSSNLLVTYNSRMELNTGNISLFDLNTLYSVENDETVLAGTEGFTAPEVEYGKADNRSDIYSLGAILFNAIAISNASEDVYYNNEYYDRIDELVVGSALIVGSKINSQFEIRMALCNILRKCLNANPAERYDYCEQLVSDLEAVKILLEAEKTKGAGVSTFLGGNDRISNSANDESAGRDTNNADVNSYNGTTCGRKNMYWLLGAVTIVALIVIAFLAGGNANKNKVTNSVNNTDATIVTVVEDFETSNNTSESAAQKNPDETDLPEKTEIITRTPEEAGQYLVKELKRASGERNPEDRIVVADADFLGCDEFCYEGYFEIPIGVTLVIPEGVYYFDQNKDTAYENYIIVWGTIDCHPYNLFVEAENIWRNCIWLENGSKGIFNGIEITMGENDYYTAGFLTNAISDGVGYNDFELIMEADAYISSSAEEFKEAGLDYSFGHSQEVINIYFEGKDEPYETYYQSTLDKLQLQIERYDGNPIILDQPIVVKFGQELWIHSGVTLIIKEGGSISVEQGGHLYIMGTLVEEGGTYECDGDVLIEGEVIQR